MQSWAAYSCVCTKYVLTFSCPAELGWSRRKSKRCLCGKRLLHFSSQIHPIFCLEHRICLEHRGLGFKSSKCFWSVWGLSVPCRSSWSLSCCQLGWPLDTPTGSSRLATPPGTSTMHRTWALPTGASSTSGGTSLSSTPWCPSPSMSGRVLPHLRTCHCEQQLALRTPLLFHLAWKWFALAKAISSTGTCRCTTPRRTQLPRPGPPHWTSSWGKSSTSSLTRLEPSHRTSWPLKSVA